jgi:hypothetical protein
MSESARSTTYYCDGFYPLEADNLAHAAGLFALWRARRKYGARGDCSRLELQTDLGVDGATFNAVINAPSGAEACTFTVLVDNGDRPSRLA